VGQGEERTVSSSAYGSSSSNQRACHLNLHIAWISSIHTGYDLGPCEVYIPTSYWPLYTSHQCKCPGSLGVGESEFPRLPSGMVLEVMCQRFANPLCFTLDLLLGLHASDW
jgi:hypothetical protein